jgi:hypothetical protein
VEAVEAVEAGYLLGLRWPTHTSCLQLGTVPFHHGISKQTRSEIRGKFISKRAFSELTVNIQIFSHSDMSDLRWTAVTGHNLSGSDTTIIQRRR